MKYSEATTSGNRNLLSLFKLSLILSKSLTLTTVIMLVILISINYDQGREFTLTLKETHTSALGKMTCFMDKEFIFITMVKFMKGQFRMDRCKGKEFTTMKTAQLIIVEDGLKEKSMAKEHTTVRKKFTKEDGSKERDMVKAITKTN